MKIYVFPFANVVFCMYICAIFNKTKNMKTKILQLGLFLLIILSSISCIKDIKGEKLRDYYLSQTRDAKLVGGWLKDNDYGYKYREDGTLYTIYVDEGGQLVEENWASYWYTKGDSLMVLDFHDSYYYPSQENVSKYKIEGDKLHCYGVFYDAILGE